MWNKTQPFGTNELYNADIDNELRKIIGARAYMITPDEIRRCVQKIRDQRDALIVASLLVSYIDVFGSYSRPVYRALSLFQSCIQANPCGFCDIAKIFAPEIQTVVYLSFGERNPEYRNQVHHLARALYQFLAFGRQLPEPGDQNPQKRRRHQSLAVRNSLPVLPTIDSPAPLMNHDDTDDLGFDPRLMNSKQNPFTTNPFETSKSQTPPSSPTPPPPQPQQPMVMNDEPSLLDFNTPVKVVAPEPQGQETLDYTPRLDLDFIAVKTPQYDYTIESF